MKWILRIYVKIKKSKWAKGMNDAVNTESYVKATEIAMAIQDASYLMYRHCIDVPEWMKNILRQYNANFGWIKESENEWEGK